MRTYYLMIDSNNTIFVGDNANAGTVIREFSAANYEAANKMFSFQIYKMGERYIANYKNAEKLAR